MREQIIAVTLDLLRTHDYDAISIRAIAERIRYSPAAIYWYFKDKDELLAQLVEDGFDELDRRCGDSIEQPQPPAAQVESIGRAYLHFGLNDPIRYRLMFMRRADLSAPREGRRPPRTASLLMLRQALERAHRSGELHAPDPAGASLHLWACWHGLLALSVDMPYLLQGGTLAETHLMYSLAPLRLPDAKGST